MSKIKLLYKFLKDPQLLNPSIVVDDISKIDYKKLKNAGIHYIVFDKDNTLTKQDEFKFYNEKIEKTIQKLFENYSQKNIAVLSNTCM